MKIIEKLVSDLIPYENNPRNNENAIESVANSIKEFGFKIPVVIDTNNVIVAGHTRILACKKLGIKSVPCVVADDLSKEQIKAFRLADNKVSELSEWDFSKLENELSELNFDMSLFDFDVEDFQESFSPQQPETKTETKTENETETFTGLPEELQGVDVTPNVLPKIKGSDETAMDRIIIIFPKDKKQKLAEHIGLDEINKIIYRLEDFGL